MKRIVHFGAGNIGRSLVGAIFSRAGWEVVFVDAVESLVRALNERRSYRVCLKGALAPGEPSELSVEGVRGLLVTDAEAVSAEIAQADLIGTSVGGRILADVLPLVALGISRRTKPISVLLCENLLHAADLARSTLIRRLPPGFDVESRVGLVETSIGKMVPLMPDDVRARDPLEVWGEPYGLIVADRKGFRGEIPDVPGLVLKDRFEAHVARKLYIHNFGHAAAAYLGFLRGHRRISECLADAPLRECVREAMDLSGRALVRRYPDEFTPEDQAAHVDDLLRRFANVALGDTVFRVGRDLPRKLAPGDRCVGALRLASEEGFDLDLPCRVMAAAFRFRATDERGAMFPADLEFLRRVEREGVESVLIHHSGFDPSLEKMWMNRVTRAYESYGRTPFDR